jgi:hypothetical protein
MTLPSLQQALTIVGEVIAREQGVYQSRSERQSKTLERIRADICARIEEECAPLEPDVDIAKDDVEEGGNVEEKAP